MVLILLQSHLLNTDHHLILVVCCSVAGDFSMLLPLRATLVLTLYVVPVCLTLAGTHPPLNCGDAMCCYVSDVWDFLMVLTHAVHKLLNTRCQSFLDSDLNIKPFARPVGMLDAGS